MLIPYNKIIKKYDLDAKVVLHIGAHEAEEHDAYFENGCKEVVWIEANPFLSSYLQNLLNEEKNTVITAAVSNVDGDEVDFIITNNGQSSSILELGLHKNLFPSVVESRRIKVQTKTVSTIFRENKISFEKVDFINLDIQGAELLALKGMPHGLANVKAIYTEVNTKEVYENCAIMSEIDEFLEPSGFERVETVMWQNHPWGDALYIRKRR